MTNMERRICLALLRRLRQQELISQEMYLAACQSRRFAVTPDPEEDRHGEP